MIEIVKTIIINVLTALYMPFGSAVLMSIFIMFFIMFGEKFGYKEYVENGCQDFGKTDVFANILALCFTQ